MLEEDSARGVLFLMKWQARSRGGKNLASGGSKEKVKLGRHFYLKLIREGC